MDNEYTEQQHQVAFVEWVRLKYPSFIIFAVPNGGKRHIKTATELKKSGAMAGIPDLVILMPNSKIVFVEMKKVKKSYLSKIQKLIIDKIFRLKHTVIVGYGANDASKKLNDYLIKIVI
jgi:hypothetical protein